MDFPALLNIPSFQSALLCVPKCGNQFAAQMERHTVMHVIWMRPHVDRDGAMDGLIWFMKGNAKINQARMNGTTKCLKLY